MKSKGGLKRPRNKKNNKGEGNTLDVLPSDLRINTKKRAKLPFFYTYFVRSRSE